MKKIYILLFALFQFSFLNAQHSWFQPGPKLNGTVKAILPGVGDSYFLLGSFTKVGEDSISGIAKWDGEKFSKVGSSGIEGTSINAAIYYNGDIVVAGNFSSIDSVVCNNIALWDGSQWSSLGNGFNYTGATTVSTLTVYKGDLYAGGSFQLSGSDSVSNIAKWNGSSWIALGDGIKGEVKTMYVHNNELYVGGTFPYAGTLQVNNIAKWDGSDWSEVGEGLEYTGATTVSTLQAYNGNLYAGGIFYNSGTTSMSHVAMWDGSQWSEVGGGLDYTGATTVSTLCFTVYNEKLIAEAKFRSLTDTNTYYYIAQTWNDTTWAVKDSRTDLPILTLQEVNNELYAGGDFTIIDSDTISFFAQWKWGTFRKGIIMEEQHYHFGVYPNPTKSELWIRPDNNTTFNFSIHDMLGRPVFTTGNVNDLHFIQPAEIGKGLYTYSITDEKGVLLQKGKLIIQ
ncbi:MAG: hypothetical protein K0Q95_2777 [Bacteroidota bacterium]|jgi:hypothetical protein|nr:hypothetical protein [Bacteroidota bacterium]